MYTLNYPLWGTELRDWLTALGVALVTLVALLLLKAYAVRRVRRRATAAPHTDVLSFTAELLGQVATPVLLAVALYVGVLVAVLPGNLERILRTVMATALLLQLAVWTNRTVSFLLERHFRRALDEDGARATTIAFLGFVSRLVLWAVVFLVALDNFGVNVTALVAGLGIGGIAVALATQNILGDVFASLSIVLDRPFVVGDHIVVDTLTGRVEHIGLKTTRVRSPSGEEIVFANSELLKSRIRNYRATYERRVLFTVGVTYRTPHSKLARIPTIIREVVDEQEQARFERAHFTRFAESSLLFEAVYFVLTSEENVFMDVQQAINLTLFSRFQREGIEFAAPARALEVRETAAAVMPRGA